MNDRGVFGNVGVVLFSGFLVFSFSGLVTGQEREKTTRNEKSSPRRAKDKERTSGVIIKVEKFQKGADKGSPVSKTTSEHPERRPILRLTINTDAVWRDWARDQAQTKDTGSAKKDAEKGKNSVATRGEPVESNSLAVVDLIDDTKIDTRFRAPDDETSKGSKQPEGVKSSDSAKPVDFKVSDLSTGLFVEIDYKHLTAQNLADRVTVIRPISPSK